MAQIVLDIPDAIAARVLDAVAAYYGWKGAGILPALPGETKAQFCKRMLAAYVKGIVKQVESQAAGDSARIAAATAADSEVIVS